MFSFGLEVPNGPSGLSCKERIFAVLWSEVGEIFGKKPGNKSMNNGALGGINTWRTAER